MISSKIYTTYKTPEEAEKEMKQATKEEMEKLASGLKNHIIKKNITDDTESDDINENIYEDSENDSEDLDDEDNQNDSLSESSSFNSITNKLLSDFNKMKYKKSKKAKLVNKQKKFQKNNSLVDSVIKIEKLKNEISKLESRIRYKDLDMSNLNLEIIKLTEFQEKYKNIESILNDLSEKEIQLLDMNQSFKNLNFNQSSKLLIFQLEELFKRYQNKNNITLIEKIKTINNPNLSRLILDKENYVIKEFNNTQLEIQNKINYINSLNELSFYSGLTFGFILFIFGMWYYYF